MKYINLLSKYLLCFCLMLGFVVAISKSHPLCPVHLNLFNNSNKGEFTFKPGLLKLEKHPLIKVKEGEKISISDAQVAIHPNAEAFVLGLLELSNADKIPCIIRRFECFQVKELDIGFTAGRCSVSIKAFKAQLKD